MPKINGKKIVLVDKNDRPSDFLLDLNSVVAKDTNGENNLNKTKPTLGDVAVAKKNKKEEINASKERKEKAKQRMADFENKAKNLTFFPLILLGFKLFKVVFKTCYAIGWAAFALIKFILKVLLKILGWFNVFSWFIYKPKEESGEFEKDIYTIFNNKLPKETFYTSTKRKMKKIDWLRPIRPFLLMPKKIRFSLPKFNLNFRIHKQAKPAEPVKHKFSVDSILQRQFKTKPISASVYLAFVMIVLILPIKAFTSYVGLNDLKGKILGISEAAMTDIKDGAESAKTKDFNGANLNFAKASDNFLAAEKEIKEISTILSIIAPVIPNKDVKMAAQADLILQAGALSTKIAQDLTGILSGLDSGNVDSEKLVRDFCDYSIAMQTDVEKLTIIIQQIDSENLPEEYKGKFKMMQDKISVVKNSTDELSGLAASLKIFLGMDYDKRYLIVFQNNAEMRASGGFIGSYAIADFSNGKLKNMEVPGGGSYDTEWGMIKKVVAPEPLSIVNPRWYFWDANWWPDWPTTANKLEWFYEQSERRTVDGVISLTPTVIEKVLEVIGPIDMQTKYGLTFTSENFWEQTQDLAETKPYATTTPATTTPDLTVKHEPKKIIGDLIEQIKIEMPKRLDREKFFSLLKVISDSIAEKQILFYFNNKELQAKVSEYGADGKIAATNWDYLMVVNTNVAGGKSDRKIKEEISHTSEVQDDGTVIDTLMIKRTHTADKNEKFTGVRNNDWMRIYVPAGSELIESSGWSRPDDIYFSKPGSDWQKDSDVQSTEGRSVLSTETNTKIYEEAGKTVFANWSQVDPGESVSIYLKYKLPFKVKPQSTERVGFYNMIVDYLNPNQKELMPFALLVQKQPGAINETISSSFKIASNLKKVWSLVEDSKESYGWQFQGNLLTDKYFAVLLSQNN